MARGIGDRERIANSLALLGLVARDHDAATASAEGRAMTMDQAIAYALEEAGR